MNIEQTEVTSISETLKIPFKESDNWFKFFIEKGNHDFEVQILKNGQYIFISLCIDILEFPIEHIEFYMKESKEEVLEELVIVLKKLTENDSRYSEKKNWFKTKMIAEINQDNEWTRFGYPGRKTNRKAST